MDSDLETRSKTIRQYREALTRPYLFDATAKFIDYWFSLPKNGLAPDKSDINPRHMLALLPGVIMLEKHTDTDEYRIRLIGTRNTSRWGFNATNSNYLDYTAPQHNQTMQKIFSDVQKYPCGVLLTGDELFASGRITRCEMVLFPVRSTSLKGELFLGLISTDHEDIVYNDTDVLATAFYKIAKTHFINIGAGVPA